MIPDVSGLTEKLGIRAETVNTAPSADLGSPFRAPTAAEMSTIQELTNRVYEVFLDRVASGRGMPKSEVQEVAQGRVWSGKDAKAVGLVDSFGSFNDALNRAASLAGLESGWATSIFDTEPSDWDVAIASLIAEEVNFVRSPWNLGVQQLGAQLSAEIIQSQNRSRVLMRMPWDLVIR